MSKRGKFDYILLETTGLADPGKYYYEEAFLYVHSKFQIQYCILLFFTA